MRLCGQQLHKIPKTTSLDLRLLNDDLSVLMTLQPRLLGEYSFLDEGYGRKSSGDEARTTESTMVVMEMEIPSWTVGAGATIVLSG